MKVTKEQFDEYLKKKYPGKTVNREDLHFITFQDAYEMGLQKEGRMVKCTHELDDALLAATDAISYLRGQTLARCEDPPDELDSASAILYIRNDGDKICDSEEYAKENWGEGTYTQVIRTDKIAEVMSEGFATVTNLLGIK